MSNVEPQQNSAVADRFMDGHESVIAVDKIGHTILFVSPSTFDTVLTLGGFGARVLEIAVAPDRKQLSS